MQQTTTHKGTLAMQTVQHIEMDLPVSSSKEYIEQALCAILYKQGDLELKQAREYLGVSRREFEEDILPKFGFSTYDDSTIDLEINNALNERS